MYRFYIQQSIKRIPFQIQNLQDSLYLHAANLLYARGNVLQESEEKEEEGTSYSTPQDRGKFF